MTLIERLKSDQILLLDGGMGTQLQGAGLQLGQRPETLCFTQPELIVEIHCRYIHAGSRLIYANTFQANAHKLAGTGYSVREIVHQAVALARRAAQDEACRGDSDRERADRKVIALENTDRNVVDRADDGQQAAGQSDDDHRDTGRADAGQRDSVPAGDDEVLVALDVGPIGELLEPLGTVRFEEAYEIYREIVSAGEEAGADLVVFETFTDLYDMKAAVLAARENTSLPIISTMTFEENHRTFTGCTVPSMALTLEGLGVDAIGFNCSLGPKEILPLMEELAQWTGLPLVIKPNAGLPDPATNEYTITAEEFAQEMLPYYERLGVKILGGCCGTTPDFIRTLNEALRKAENRANAAERAVVQTAGAEPGTEQTTGAEQAQAAEQTAKQVPGTGQTAELTSGVSHEETMPQNAGSRPHRHGVCCPSHVAELNGVRVIGERINPTGKKRFQQALREYDLNYILERGIEQQEAGADILDVNVGLPGLDEPKMMTDVVKALQGVVDLPLQIDSSDPAAIEAGLRVCNGKAIVNSVNGKREVLDRILPIVKKYGAAVIGLTMDENGIPQTAEARFEIAQRILDAALSYGIPREDVFIDCLTLTVSAQQDQAKETLKAVRWVTERLGLHTVLGVSNISFGLPDRARITESFLVQAMQCGLDLPIINPNQKQIMDAVATFKVLSGEDRDGAVYIERFANAAPPQTSAGAVGSKSAAVSAGASSGMDLEAAVMKGLKEECARLTGELLETKDELTVINEYLIPALDKVGDRYETGEIFLPQLINAANASCEGFEVIKKRIANRGGDTISKGKIIVATVEGDIHDIGKNIVKVILENYGYQVIDLGRDVPVMRVVEAAIEQDVHLIGLSALMTTTVSSMAATIAALRESGHPCKIWVGGAVLTPEYAMEIGADYYAKDAKQSVDIAKEVLG